MHGYSYLASVVIALKHRLHHAIRSYAPVAKWQVRICLQFVAQTPSYHARMVSVALDKLRQLVWPLLHPWSASACILVEPLIVEFVKHKDAERVAEVEE